MRSFLLGRRAVPAAVAVWALAWFVAMAWHGGASWHFFVQGGRALADLDDPAGGLHLYAAAPVLQIGPVAFLTVDALALVSGRPPLPAAQLLGVAAGAYVLWQARRFAIERWGDRRRANRRIAYAAVAFVPAWMYLAVASAHLDDVLALTAGVAAVAAARARRPWLTGVLLGLAVDAKPWAVGFAAVLLILPGPRAWVRGSIATGAVAVAGWLPFFAADPRTARLLHFTIPNTSLPALRALGVTDARTPPWDRPAQALIGIALGVVAVRRGAWPAVLLLAVAARIALDPGTNKYYAAGIAVGALLWDLAGTDRRLPWWTAAGAAALYLSRWIPMPPSAHGWLTLLFCAACTLTLWSRARRPAEGGVVGRHQGPGSALIIGPYPPRERPIAEEPR